MVRSSVLSGPGVLWLLVWPESDSLLNHVSCWGHIVSRLHSVFWLSSLLLLELTCFLARLSLSWVLVVRILEGLTILLLLLWSRVLYGLSTKGLLTHSSGPISSNLASVLLLLVVGGLSLKLLLVSAHSLLNLMLGSPDDIVDLGPDLFDLLLSIEALSHLLVSLNETLKLLL